MFPNSKIATQYASGRTKTTAIVETLAKGCDDNISNILQKEPYSIGTDASTDMESIKLFPLVVKYFDSKHVVYYSETECNTLHFNQTSQGLGVYVDPLPPPPRFPLGHRKGITLLHHQKLAPLRLLHVKLTNVFPAISGSERLVTPAPPGPQVNPAHMFIQHVITSTNPSSMPVRRTCAAIGQAIIAAVQGRTFLPLYLLRQRLYTRCMGHCWRKDNWVL